MALDNNAAAPRKRPYICKQTIDVIRGWIPRETAFANDRSNIHVWFIDSRSEILQKIRAISTNKQRRSPRHHVSLERATVLKIMQILDCSSNGEHKVEMTAIKQRFQK